MDDTSLSPYFGLNELARNMKTLFLAISLLATCNAYTVQQPVITLLEPQGISFAYPAESGITLVAYHYSINQQVVGVSAGQYNYDVNTATNGYFVSENTAVDVNPGDKVYYWVNVIQDGAGYLLTDQTWTAVGDTTTTTTTAATTTTTTEGNTVTQEPEPTNPPSGGGSGNGGGTVIVSDVCASYPCDSSCDMSVPPCNGLIFQENWDTLDMTRWQHEITMGGGGNWEFQYYTNNRSNSYVRDNTLFIKPTLTSDKYGEPFLSSGTLDIWGSSPADLCTGNAFYGCSRAGNSANYINPIQSARIRSVNSFAFKYGRIIVKAKMPSGDWIWPAIWMLPRSNAYGQWPASGEIDIVESRGNADLHDGSTSKGNDNMGMTLHWGPYWPLNGYTKTTIETHDTFATEFHDYEVDWSEDSIVFKLDGKVLKTISPPDGFWNYGDFDTQAPGIDNPWENSPNKMTPFDQEFYILINVAVGGTNGFFQDSWANGGYAKPWSNTSPTAMKDFWQQKNNWYPTWNADANNGEDAALQVKSIEVWAN